MLSKKKEQKEKTCVIPDYHNYCCCVPAGFIQFFYGLPVDYNSCRLRRQAGRLVLLHGRAPWYLRAALLLSVCDDLSSVESSCSETINCECCTVPQISIQFLGRWGVALDATLNDCSIAALLDSSCGVYTPRWGPILRKLCVCMEAWAPRDPDIRSGAVLAALALWLLKL